jgi:hypothetical protein
MSKAEVKELIAKASTSEDHHRLAVYFNQKAEMMDAEAVEHDELAREYANNPGVAAMKQTHVGQDRRALQVFCASRTESCH